MQFLQSPHRLKALVTLPWPDALDLDELSELGIPLSERVLISLTEIDKRAAYYMRTLTITLSQCGE